MEKTTNMDNGEQTIVHNHYRAPSRKRAGSREDYKALLDSTEEARQHDYVKNTPFGEIRDVRRLRCVEWFFLVLATLTILGLLGVAIERFVNLHHQFGSFVQENCTNNASVDATMAEESGTPVDTLPLYDNGYRLLRKRDQIDIDDSLERSDHNESLCDKTCDHWTCTNDFIFAMALVVNLLFCSFYCYNGLLRERRFELVGYAVSMAIILLYVIINFCMVKVEGDYARLVRLILMCIFGPQNIVLAIAVSAKMGYLVLNTVGTSQNLIRAYRTKSIFLTLQKFNLQLLANIIVLSWAKGGLFISTAEKVIVFLLLIYMFAVSYVGWTSLTWELGVLAGAWHVFLMPAPGFYIYKIANVAHHWSTYQEVYAEYSFQGRPGDPTHFIYVAATIITACCVGVLCCIALSALMLLTHSNFGRGLKEKLPPPCCSEEREQLN